MGDADTYDHLLHTFVGAARRRSRASTDELFTAISAYQATTHPEFADVSEVLQYTRTQADDIIATIASGELLDALDPAVPCLVSLCYEMGQILGDFALVHDESKTISRHSDQLLALHELPDAARPGQLMQRLPMTSITFSDSSAVPQLQLADWAAGAVRQRTTHLATGLPDPFAEKLQAVVEPWLLGGIWPDLSTVENPRRLELWLRCAQSAAK